MKKKQTTFRISPELLALHNEGLLTKSNLYFVSIIYLSKTDKEYTPMNSQLMIEYMGNTYAKQIGNMIQMGIVECDNHYEIGSKSKGYKITPQYSTKFTYRVQVNNIDDEALYTAIINSFITTQRFRDQHLKWMKECIQTVKFNQDAAYKWAEENIKDPKKYSAAIQAIDNVSFIDENRHYSHRFCKRSHVNHRVDTNLTNMNKGLIQFLEDDNWVQIDTANSQPLLFTILLSKHFDNKDVKFALDLAKNGVIYEYFAEKLGLKREQVKKRFMSLMFNKGKTDNLLINYVREHLIGLYDAIKHFKSDEHTLLKKCKINGHKAPNKRTAIAMQRMEASIWIDGICKDVFEQIQGVKFYTKHDSILIHKDNLSKVIEIIEQNYTKSTGITPKLGITDLKGNKIVEEKQLTNEEIEDVAIKLKPIFTTENINLYEISGVLKYEIAKRKIRTYKQFMSYFQDSFAKLSQRNKQADWNNFKFILQSQ